MAKPPRSTMVLSAHKEPPLPKLELSIEVWKEMEM